VEIGRHTASELGSQGAVGIADPALQMRLKFESGGEQGAEAWLVEVESDLSLLVQGDLSVSLRHLLVG